jgi:autophagy-related protein 27
MCVQLLDFFPERPDIQLSAPKFISLLLNGPDYSSPSPIPQSLNLTVICNPSETSDPKFIAYDGSRLDVEWSGPAGCPFRSDGGNEDGDKKDDKSPDHESVGSGLGWFFLAYVVHLIMKAFPGLSFTFHDSIFLCFAAYFGLGAYYNYSIYGARGADLIP